MTEANKKEHLDLRVQRTYKLLSTSFEQLLKEKSFEQITVQEICENAMVRRTTFYQHFPDKVHFLVWFLRIKQQEFLEENLPLLNTNSFRECFTSIMSNILIFLKENRQIISSLVNSGLGDPGPVNDMVDSFSQKLSEMFHAFPEAHQVPPEVPVQLAANYYMGAVKGAARWWFREGCSYPEDQLAKHIYTLLRTTHEGLDE